MTDIDPALIEAYRETEYRVDDDPPLVLRIDEPSDDLRILLASFGVQTAAYLTAWNPGSVRLTDEENYDRQAQLLHEIEMLRLNYLVGHSEHPTGAWHEDSYLVLGMTRAQAEALARRFGQNGFVWMEMDGVPRLVLVG